MQSKQNLDFPTIFRDEKTSQACVLLIPQQRHNSLVHQGEICPQTQPPAFQTASGKSPPVFPAIYTGIPPAISQKKYIHILNELHFAAADVLAENGNEYGNFMLVLIITIITTIITEDW